MKITLFANAPGAYNSVFHLKVRNILKENGYRLSGCDVEGWQVMSDNRVFVSGKTLMSVADQMCPILHDERLSLLCAAV